MISIRKLHNFSALPAIKSRRLSKPTVRALTTKHMRSSSWTPVHDDLRALIQTRQGVDESQIVKISGSINAQDDAGYHLLQWAACAQCDETVRALILHGADVNQAGFRKRTALHAAVKNDSELSILILMERGANVNATDDQGCTPLHVAARYNEVSSARVLLRQSQTNLDARNDKQNTPLHDAAFGGSKEITVMLLDRGVDIESVGFEEQTALHMAAFQNRGEITNILMQRKANINARDRHGRTPLIVAAWAKGHKAARALVYYKADLELKDKKDRSALFWAREFEDREMEEILLGDQKPQID